MLLKKRKEAWIDQYSENIRPRPLFENIFYAENIFTK